MSITFDGDFCAENIALKELVGGNLYLGMPKYQDYRTEEYLPYFAFKDAEFRKPVIIQTVEAYGQIENKQCLKGIRIHEKISIRHGFAR